MKTLTLASIYELQGFKKEAIARVLKKITVTNTSSIVKEALKLLQR